jgi:hypothetical protein
MEPTTASGWILRTKTSGLGTPSVLAKCTPSQFTLLSAPVGIMLEELQRRVAPGQFWPIELIDASEAARAVPVSNIGRHSSAAPSCGPRSVPRRRVKCHQNIGQHCQPADCYVIGDTDQVDNLRNEEDRAKAGVPMAPRFYPSHRAPLQRLQ